MSLSLAKKSLSFIDSTNTKSKTKKSKNKKNNFKRNQQESSTDNHTDQIVKTLLAYNDTNFDEKIAKKVNIGQK